MGQYNLKNTIEVVVNHKREQKIGQWHKEIRRKEEDLVSHLS